MPVGKATRTGALRIPSNLVSSPADLTPNVQLMTDAFRKGQITANDIRDRFGKRAIEEDRARTAQAVVATREAEEVAPLKIEAAKKTLSPEMIDLQVQAEKGKLEDAVAENAFRSATRKERDRYNSAILAQAVDEIEGGLKAEAVRQMAFDHPNLIRPQYDSLGRVVNKEEVKAQIARVRTQQKWIDAMRDLAKDTERQEIEHADGTKETRVVVKGTNIPVTPAQQQAIWSAQTTVPGGVIDDPQTLQHFQNTFGAPGQVTAPVAPQAAAPGQQAAAPPAAGSAPQVPTPVQQPTAGQATPSGGVITGVSNRQRQVLTDIQGFVQKSKPVQTYETMAPFAAQANTLEQKFVPGTAEYSPEFERNGKALDHSLIFNYMKLVDPTSVVREGEFKYATQLSPIDDYIINSNNLKNKWLNRQIMTDSTRRAIMDRIKELTYATAESAAMTLGSFSDQAQREGLSPDQAIGASNADLLRFFGKLPGTPQNIPPFLHEAKAFVDVRGKSQPSTRTDAGGRPDPAQIVRLKPDDAEGIAKARRTGGWFWIQGEPNPRRFR